MRGTNLWFIVVLIILRKINLTYYKFHMQKGQNQLSPYLKKPLFICLIMLIVLPSAVSGQQRVICRFKAPDVVLEAQGQVDVVETADELLLEAGIDVKGEYPG